MNYLLQNRIGWLLKEYDSGLIDLSPFYCGLVFAVYVPGQGFRMDDGNHEPSSSSGWDAVLHTTIQDATDTNADADRALTEKPRRGRTKGTKGSHLVRADDAGRALQQNIGDALSAQADELELPMWGMLSGAMSQISVSKHQDAVQQQAQQFGPHAAVLQVGTPCQKIVSQTLFQALQSKRASLSDVSILQLPLSDSASREPINRFLDGSALTCSASSLAKMHGTDKAVLQRQLLASAAVVVESSCVLTSAMITSSLNSAKPADLEPLLFCLRLRYDETPSNVRVIAAGDASGNATSLIVPKPASSGQALKRFVSAQGFSVQAAPESSSHAKILQTQMEVGLLFQRKQPQSSSARGPEQDYIWIRIPVPCSLSAMDRTTGETERAAVFDNINRIPELSRLTKDFKYKMRLSCTDRYGAHFDSD